MSGLEGTQSEHHDERQARWVRSIEIRATEVETALWTLQLAAVVDKFSGTVRAEEGRVALRRLRFRADSQW